MPSATTRGYEYPVAGDPIGDGAAKIQELAETIDDQLKRIESGTVTSASIASGTSADVAITFGAAFGAAPKVIASNATNRNDPHLMAITVKTVTTTGAVVRVRNDTGSAVAITVAWIAQG